MLGGDFNQLGIGLHKSEVIERSLTRPPEPKTGSRTKCTDKMVGLRTKRNMDKLLHQVLDYGSKYNIRLYINGAVNKCQYVGCIVLIKIIISPMK